MELVFEYPYIVVWLLNPSFTSLFLAIILWCVDSGVFGWWPLAQQGCQNVMAYGNKNPTQCNWGHNTMYSENILNENNHVFMEIDFEQTLYSSYLLELAFGYPYIIIWFQS